MAGWEIFFLHPMGPPAESTRDLGSHVTLFDPSMPASEIQSRLNAVFAEMEENPSGDERHRARAMDGPHVVQYP